MGLIKQLTTPNGVPLNYHRVVSVNVITNDQNIIEVASYISQEKRREEQEAQTEAQETGIWPEMDVYIHTQAFSAPYDQDMTIRSAYAWLKENAGFGDAEDAFEEDEEPCPIRIMQDDRR